MEQGRGLNYTFPLREVKRGGTAVEKGEKSNNLASQANRNKGARKTQGDRVGTILREGKNHPPDVLSRLLKKGGSSVATMDSEGRLSSTKGVKN